MGPIWTILIVAVITFVFIDIGNKRGFIKRFIAWRRIIVWGFCPKCNSDAPELYDCEVCNWDTTSPFGKEKRKRYWSNWKEQNKKQL